MKDLTEGKEGKLIWRFAIPMLLGNVFQQLYNVVDSWVVGNYLGKEALSAVGASFPLIFLLISLVIGIAMGSTIIISQYFGAKDYDKVKVSIDTLYIIMFFASIFVTAIGLIFSRQIFELIKLPEEVIPEAILYFNIFMSGSIFMFGFHGTSAILRGLGDSKTPLYFMIISTIANIILDLLFVVKFGMGIEGVAYASVIAQAGALLTAIIYLNKTHKLIRISFLRLRFDKEIFIKSVKIGIPSGLQQTFVALGMLALFRIVNDFGTETIAAYSVAARIDSFASMPAMNFAAALGAFVGQNMGANKQERVKAGMIATLRMTGVISIAISILVIFFGHELMAFFSTDAGVVSSGETYLQVVGGFYIIFSSMFVINAVFRGSGDTLMPMFITLFALWIIRVPLSWWLSTIYGEVGIWWGIPAGWFAGMSLSLIYYFTGRWKLKVVVKHNDQ
ncbi:MAG: MATE family efflux transporter [Bacteroidales bacterium]|nr:MATE family efflux transporter [Bacteroidales bacterium]MCF8457367.1 MATE family efflux transporter [Bacteroidales bacterium]